MAVIGVNTAEVEIFFILYSTMHKVATTNTYKQYIHTYIISVITVVVIVFVPRYLCVSQAY